MTSETDYSIQRPTGAREIPSLRPVSDRKRPRGRRRRRRDRLDDAAEEEGVQVELTDEPIDTGDVPTDEQDNPPDKPAVDYLA